MIKLPKSFSIVAGIFLLFSAFGGELAELSKELNFIEYSFTYAAMQPEMSENRQNVKRRLQNFYSRLVQFDRTLKRKKVPGIPNFLDPASRLNLAFEALGQTNGAVRLPRYRGTSLGNYSKTYNEYLRDINRLEGKKSRGSRAVPTLKNIPLDNYKAWLDRVSQDYIQSLRRISKRSDSSRQSKNRKSSRNNKNKLSTSTVNILEGYIVNVAKLRFFFAKIAQNKFYKE